MRACADCTRARRRRSWAGWQWIRCRSFAHMRPSNMPDTPIECSAPSPSTAASCARTFSASTKSYLHWATELQESELVGPSASSQPQSNTSRRGCRYNMRRIRPSGFTAVQLTALRNWYMTPSGVSRDERKTDLRTKYRGHGIPGLYHGLSATLLFRTFFFFWWGSYDIFSRLLSKHTSLSTPAVNFWAGGLSAQIFWITSYPSDVVKQRIMTDPLGAERRFPRWRDAAKAVYREKGWKGYWRGFVPCFLRAFPANAMALVAFEGVMRFQGAGN